jgi:excinuclease UvrABC nuclease subunit
MPLPRFNDDESVIEELQRDMLEAAERLEFERAAYLRDQILTIKRKKDKIKPE